LGTFALLPHLPFILQSLLCDNGWNGYGGESGRVMTYIYTIVLSLHVFVPKVLCGVLHPKVHNNGFEKKKKKTLTKR
jgi:hypothetical protein